MMLWKKDRMSFCNVLNFWVWVGGLLQSDKNQVIDLHSDPQFVIWKDFIWNMMLQYYWSVSQCGG